jgi:hypothetical protein
LHIGQNVKEILDCDLASEMSARTLYEEAATHCHSVKDYVSRDLFESIMSGFKNSAGELVDFITVDEAHDNWTGSDEWIWIAIDDDNRCEDCSERDGEVNSWSEWQAIGLPGMGTTVCGWRCRCSLEPAELAADATLPGL